MTTEKEPTEELAELSQYDIDMLLSTRLPFGKHKGTAMRDVPEDYLEWLASPNKQSQDGGPFRYPVWERRARLLLQAKRVGFKPAPQHLDSLSVPVDLRSPKEILKGALNNALFFSQRGIDTLINADLEAFVLAKEADLSTWFRNYLKEALRYGEVTKEDSVYIIKGLNRKFKIQIAESGECLLLKVSRTGTGTSPESCSGNSSED